MWHTNLVDSIFKPGWFQLIADKYISIISVGHYTLQFCIAQKVCKYITTTRAILIEENGCFPGLVDQNPNVALLIVIVFTHFTPGLVAVHNRIFFQSYRLQYTNQFVQVCLTFLKPVAQRVFRNGHAHICQPLVKKTKSHILYINFIGNSLQKFRSGPSAFKTGYYIRMAFRREIAPLRLFTRLCIMNHLKTFFRKESTETEHPYHSPFNDPTGNLCQIGRMLCRLSGYSHRFITVRAIGQVTVFPGRLF